eukprot:TRINITY_DN64352_c1_g1_i1.p1 TRINITY_DN64352_c1_g1~~TRINITY_DN64352_c1_g1_i1.p1  ORF type:complete len:781 (-),score=48.30 TRINITY_DN64352_c1_g1_i1:157-2433(-)
MKCYYNIEIVQQILYQNQQEMHCRIFQLKQEPCLLCYLLMESKKVLKLVEFPLAKEPRCPHIVLSSEFQKVSTKQASLPLIAVSTLGLQKSGKSTIQSFLFDANFPRGTVLSEQTTTGCDCIIQKLPGDDRLLLLIDSQGYCSMNALEKYKAEYKNSVKAKEQKTPRADSTSLERLTLDDGEDAKPEEKMLEKMAKQIERKFTVKFGSFIWCISTIIIFCLEHIPIMHERSIFEYIQSTASSLETVNSPYIIFVCRTTDREGEEVGYKNLIKKFMNQEKKCKGHKVFFVPTFNTNKPETMEAYKKAVSNIREFIFDYIANVKVDSTVTGSMSFYQQSVQYVAECLEKDARLFTLNEIRAMESKKGLDKAIELYNSQCPDKAVLTVEGFQHILQKAELELRKVAPYPDELILEKMKKTLVERFEVVNKQCSKKCESGTHNCTKSVGQHKKEAKVSCVFNCNPIPKHCPSCNEVAYLKCTEKFEVPHMVKRKCLDGCGETLLIDCTLKRADHFVIKTCSKCGKNPEKMKCSAEYPAHYVTKYCPQCGTNPQTLLCYAPYPEHWLTKYCPSCNGDGRWLRCMDSYGQHFIYKSCPQCGRDAKYLSCYQSYGSHYVDKYCSYCSKSVTMDCSSSVDSHSGCAKNSKTYTRCICWASLKHEYPPYKWQCDVCGAVYSSSTPCYRHGSCGFDVCYNCYNVTLAGRKKCPAGHALVLSTYTGRVYSNGYYKCDGPCNRGPLLCTSGRWFCTYCNYDLCSSCYQLS